MHLLSILALVPFAALVAADSGDDFSNNLFSDLAPLLALFGERVTMQFMSQSTGWADNIILAMAPLGIITAIVSAIRVGGPSWLKALIGRARENLAAAEAELMSSTSEEVCELWNGREIVRCTGSAPICEFICLLPGGNSGTSSGLDKEDGKVSNDNSYSNVEVMKLEEAIEKQYLDKLGSSDSSSQSDSSNLDPEKGNGPVEQSNIVITRNERPAPNISLNSHKQFGRGELRAGAVLGTILQLGVLIYSGFATYYPSLKFRKDGHRVADYAYPCFAGGTLLLVTGMLICAHVVESSTEEETYQPKDGRAARLVWLQQRKTVSDQVFESNAIYTEDDRSLITTSSRISNQDNLIDRKKIGTAFFIQRLSKKRDDEGQSIGLEFKTIVGTAVSLCGFVAQFIGLRGMHWSVSIAQLVAVGVMTALRAWVRRGLAIVPRAQLLTPGFELEWFALTLGNPPEAPWWRSSDPEESLRSDSDWRVVTGESSDVYQELKLADKDTSSKAHRVMRLRADLGILAGWPGLVSSEAISLARAIEITMDTLMKSSAHNNWTWSLKTHYGQSDVKFRVERQAMGSWRVYTDEIEAALSLWLYSVNEKEKDRKRRKGPQDLPGARDEDIWLRDKGSPTNPNLQLLGPYTPELHRDLQWWMPGSVARVTKVKKSDHETPMIQVEGAADTSTDNIKMFEVQNYRVVGCGPISSSKDSRPDDRSAFMSWDLEEWTLKSSVDKGAITDVLLATESYCSLKALYSRDMFTAFMWALAKTLTNPVEDESEVLPNDSSGMDDWKSFTIRSHSLSRMCQDIQMTGLGTLEEVYMSVIPPLSIEKKLPEADRIVELVREHATPHERVQHWKGAGDAYLWLFEIAKTFSKESAIVTRATTVLMEYLRMITLTLEWRKIQCYENSDVGAMEDVKSIIEEKLADGELNIVSAIMELYEQQGRGWKCAIFKDTQKAVENDRANRIPILSNSYPPLWYDVNVDNTSNNMARRVNERDAHEWTALHYAAAKGDETMIEKLLGLGGDVNAKDLRDWTPLHYACKHGNTSAVKTLLQEGAEVDIRGLDGISPLHCAAMSNSFEVVRLLSRVGAAIDILDIWGNTPLHLASYEGHLAVVQYLWEDANKKLQNSNGRTALHLAAIANKWVVVKWLAAEAPVRPDMEARDEDGRTPLHCAVVYNHATIVQVMLEGHDPSLDVEDKRGWTPLYQAANDGYEDIVSALLGNGAKVNVMTREGRTALGIAASKKYWHIVLALLEYDVRVAVAGSKLHWAVMGGHSSLVEILIAQSVQVDTRDKYGRTPLNWAASDGYEDIVQALIIDGASVDAPDEYNRTPLYWAATEGHSTIVLDLLRNKADVGIIDGYGRTPLHRAADEGHLAVVHALLVNGAPEDIKDKSGRTPLDYAERNDHHAVVKLLRHE